MPVQLHYYGTKLDLDPTQPDEMWTTHVEDELRRVRESGKSGAMSVDLSDGGTATLFVYHDSPLILVRSAPLLG